MLPRLILDIDQLDGVLDATLRTKMDGRLVMRRVGPVTDMVVSLNRGTPI